MPGTGAGAGAVASPITAVSEALLVSLLNVRLTASAALAPAWILNVLDTATTGAGAVPVVLTVPAVASNSLLPLNCVLASVEVICVFSAETSACMFVLSDEL
ncbi:hypothetical protein WR25_24682 [Diploscapter pachys]|uniref:Uncharacterized protein n=1 Tax=Diploscapter pachys TaxID=2018661 RepID=A0A2A2KBX4_9BILA|nr:hypothetical protein WR25_24682 [Diploscapter pachys]